MRFQLHLGMQGAKRPFAGWVALDMGNDRAVCVGIERVNDYERTVRIK